jgi:hypothetical protein
MDDANPIGMPLDPQVNLTPNPKNHSNSFAKLLRELQYIANNMGPDINYSTNRLGAYTANLSLQHYRLLKWILSYLVGMRTLGITYCTSQDDNEENLFHSFSNAAYAN